jgi:hypothetical protein
VRTSVANRTLHLVMAVPIRLLWNLQIGRIEKLSIALVMCVGVITMVCAIVRASSLGVFAEAGQIPISWLVLWASIEGFVGTSNRSFDYFYPFPVNYLGS